MKKIFKFLKRAVILSALVSTITVSVHAEVVNNQVYEVETDKLEGWPKAPDIFSEAGVLIEANTGAVLYNKGMNQLKYPASITKIMTVYLLLENMKPDENITFTKEGVQEVYPGSANIKMVEGEVLTVEQCAYAILLSSANEVSTQVAISISGSLEEFTKLMNKTAKEFGCENTNFQNANGLPNENHYTTAYDIALMSVGILKNEEFRKVVGTTNYDIPPTNKTTTTRTLTSHHSMIMPGEYHYEGVYGGKTGNTNEAKSTLVTYANKNDMDLICVVLRAEGGQVVEDTKNLLNYGFEKFKGLSVSKVDEGSVIVPKDVVETQLELEESIQGDTTYYHYTYQGQAVGTLSKQIEAVESATELANEDEEKSTTKEEELKKEGERIRRINHQKKLQRRVLFVLLAAVLVVGSILVITIINRMKRRKK